MESGVTEGAARVARVLLQLGPMTAPGLADQLGLSAQAVRRQLDQLTDDGLIDSGERPPFGPRPARRRGRPPRVYFLTEAGLDLFQKSYDDLAVAALRFLAKQEGRDQIAAFVEHRGHQLEQRYWGSDVFQLADRMKADGYAASVIAGANGEPLQLCQHHCPVGHVAAEFPALCEAEAEAFSRLLGVHVQRLATLAHGDHVCTTFVPTPNTHTTSSHTLTTPTPTSERASS